MTLMIPEIGWVEVEEESTYGTDPASSPFNLILTEMPDIPVPTRENIGRNRVRPDGGREPHAVLDRRVEGSFQTAIAPIPDSDGAVPSVAPIIKSAGFNEATSGTAAGGDLKASYRRTYRAISSCTLKFYVADKDSATDYVKLVVTGCRCSFDIDYSLGQEVLMNVSFMGLFSSWNDFADESAAEPSTFHQGKTPFTTQNHSFQVDGSDVSLSNFALDIGASPNEIPEVMAASTAKEIRNDNLSQAPTGSFDPLVESVGATDDVVDLRKSGNEKPIELDVVSGNDEFNIKCGSAQINEDPSFDAADAYYRYGASFVANAATSEARLRWQETS